MTTFAEFQVPTPDPAELRARFERLREGWRRSRDRAERASILREWQQTRWWLYRWRKLRATRHFLDPASMEARAAAEEAAALTPRIQSWDAAFRAELLRGPHRAELEGALGAPLLRRWELELRRLLPRLEDARRREGAAGRAWAEAWAGAEIDGRTGPGHEAAMRAGAGAGPRWRWFEARSDALEDAFNQGLQARVEQASALGVSPGALVDLRRRRSLDPESLDAFIDRVRRELVPALHRALGDRPPDRWLLDGPRPKAGLPDRLGELLGAIDPRIADGWAEHRRRGLVALDDRPGAMSGGFCDVLHDEKQPFVHLPLCGSWTDVRGLIHELGHAWQWSERVSWWTVQPMPMLDSIWPDATACELHGTGLEWLALPHLGAVFDEPEAARRAWRLDLAERVAWGCALTTWEAAVAEGAPPDPAWAAARGAFLPWRDPGDVGFLRRGGDWRAEATAFLAPGHALDMALAVGSSAALSPEAWMGMGWRGGDLDLSELLAEAEAPHPLSDEAFERVGSWRGAEGGRNREPVPRSRG